MTPEQAADKIILAIPSHALLCLFPSERDDLEKAINEAIHAQRAEAVAEFKERILRVIDSQTHSSELGDAYRHIRQLVGMLPPAQEG